jgi:hypothetical protein
VPKAGNKATVTPCCILRDIDTNSKSKAGDSKRKRQKRMREKVNAMRSNPGHLAEGRAIIPASTTKANWVTKHTPTSSSKPSIVSSKKPHPEMMGHIILELSTSCAKGKYV